jgi:hypothetical protein
VQGRRQIARTGIHSTDVDRRVLLVCSACRATIAQVSGKAGGYYGCLAATKGACENKTSVRRSLVEKMILNAVQEQTSHSEHIANVLKQVEAEIAKLRVDALTDEVDALRRSREKIFRPPPIAWIKDRLSNLQEVLEQRTEQSAQVLRNPPRPDPDGYGHAGHRLALL